MLHRGTRTACGAIVEVPYQSPLSTAADGRTELMWYQREQSTSFDYHRIGMLGDRGEETRAETL